MTYDYFNTSNLAFGNKLTKAFLSLTKLADDCNTKCQEVINRWEIYSQFLGRNYLVPRPTQADNPVRTTEFYNAISGTKLFIEKMIYENNRLTLILHKFTPTINRITKLTGSTRLKKGYVFIQEAISNNNIDRTINFVEEEKDGVGTLLFQYSIDRDGVINLIDDVSSLLMVPNDITQYTSLDTELLFSGRLQKGYRTFAGNTASGEWGTSQSFEYTTPEPMCILAIGSSNYMQITKNDKIIAKLKDAYQVGPCSIIYASEGDVFKFENCVKVYRIKYLQNMPDSEEEN